MPIPALDACFYVATAPDIAFKDGHFHIAYELGRMRIECVMPPNTYMRSLAKAAATAREFRIAGAEVIPLHSVEDDEAASA